MAHFCASVSTSAVSSLPPSHLCGKFPKRKASSEAHSLPFTTSPAPSIVSLQHHRNPKPAPFSPYRGSAVMSYATTSSPAADTSLILEKPVLFDFPLSNNGAQVRFVIYGKGLESEFDIKSPQTVGGMKSETYLRYNPEGKSPLLVLPSGLGIPESEVISEYIMDKYASVGPSFVPKTPELRAVSNTTKRIVDIYIKPAMGAMYRGGYTAEARSAAIAELARQLDIIERVILADPYVAGPEISTGDFSLFAGALVFMNLFLPTYFGWESIFTGRPKLKKWWDTMNELPLAQRIRGEMEGGLKSWNDAGRWQNLGILDQVADKTFRWSF
eukprot:TRINITY_DN2411_c4_g1_i1.p1 TRINITY_DN2411_c4_g1~~TRINITY_DN2411_c4_g1_i1.p1  ORF type:complete len:328 (+),score=40.82 TRINITY_DN2411_c4_g1_i1:56-1039(+)